MNRLKMRLFTMSAEKRMKRYKLGAYSMDFPASILLVTNDSILLPYPYPDL